MSTVSVTNIT